MRIRISWINQYMFCPYGFYLEHVLGLKPIKTQYLVTGTKIHAELQKKYLEEGWEVVDIKEALYRSQKNREIFKYRELQINASFPRWELTGKMDELWIYPDQVLIIEDKPGNQAYDGGKYQVMGYALALKHVYHPSIPIQIAVRNRDTQEIMWNEEFDQSREKDVSGILDEIYLVLSGEKIPAAKPSPKKCEHCGFREFCNRKYESRLPDSNRGPADFC